MRSRASFRAYDQRRLSRILTYVAEHVSERLTLNGVSRACGVSPSTAQRLLHGGLDAGFREALQRARVGELLSALALDPELKDDALLFATGWRSRTTLYTVTRRITGHSLRRLRDNPTTLARSLRALAQAAEHALPAEGMLEHAWD